MNINIKKPKIDFFKGYLGSWNSGSSTRSWENWIRIWRNTEGIFNAFARKNFTLEHPKVALKQILDKIQADGFKILLSSEDYLAVMKIEEGVHGFSEGTDVPVAYAEFAVNDTTLQASYEGDLSIVQWFTVELSQIFSSYGQTVHRLLGFGSNGPEIKQEFLFNKPEVLSKDYYYPWLKEAGYESIADLVQQYNSSTNNALLFIGPPGTGKSSLIRTLLILVGRENNSIVESEQAVTHPGFNSWLGGVKHGSMVALEDNDSLVRAREDGNSVMATLLNVTQGIVQSDIKIVITTNLKSTKDVDSALTRPGRCFDVLEFRHLTADEAMTIREKDGLSFVDFYDIMEESGVNAWSLAEVLNYRDGYVRESKKTGNQFGFAKHA